MEEKTIEINMEKETIKQVCSFIASVGATILCANAAKAFMPKRFKLLGTIGGLAAGRRVSRIASEEMEDFFDQAYDVIQNFKNSIVTIKKEDPDIEEDEAE